MAEVIIGSWKESKAAKLIFGVVGIMGTLLVYGVLQEKIMSVPYGEKKEYFRFSLFLVLCNRILTSAVSGVVLLISEKTLIPAAPMHKYCAVSLSNILTTTCQYEALKYVSFPVQTLAKSAKMIPVMVWSTIIMRKKYNGKDYLFALLVTLGCFVFILYPVSYAINTHQVGRENTLWGIFLMIGYLGCFLKVEETTLSYPAGIFGLMALLALFKINSSRVMTWKYITKYSTLHYALLFLVFVGHLLMAIDFMLRHQDCIFDVLLLSTVATASQFFISYTIRTFGALTFATIMTTRQLVSILLSCFWFSHPLSWVQWSGAVIVFGSLYIKSFLRSSPHCQLPSVQANDEDKTQKIIVLDTTKSSNL